MRRIVATVLLIVPSIAFAQSIRSTITGSVTNPDGHAVKTATLEFKNVESGKSFESSTSAKGSYTLSGLPDGTEEIQEYICDENNQDLEHLLGK